ncbi:MAG: ribonucleotide-diphosphate reductase subunit alpha, partial [Bacteroidota bacterium]
VAPTTSSSAILGQASPGIEPFSSNYYKAGLSKGNFIRKNKYLRQLLIEKGLDNEDTWRSIMLNHGSVQHLDELSAEEKEVFKTFKEISQLEIIQQAAIRQKYIDQAQSLNLNIPHNLPVKEVNKLMIEAWKLGVKTLYYQRSQSVSKEFISNIVNCSSCEA